MISNSNPDLLIVGAGIFGLWAARHALKAGKSVHVYEKRTVGAGASGGFLGALMPHMPDSWNEKKQMQFDALCALPERIAALEEETGTDCGYRRCGRLMPLIHGQMVEVAEARRRGANRHWTLQKDDTKPDFEVMTRPALQRLADNWLSPDRCKFGATFDGLSARINPRNYISALNQYVSSHAQCLENKEVVMLDPERGRVQLKDGSWVSAGHILVAAGYEAYPMLQPFIGRLNGNQNIGRGVKGQAVLLEFVHDDTLPIVYHDGAYIVPHENNRVAIGSSSQGDWDGEPDAFDPQTTEFVDKALNLVPALGNAPVVERWAGVRPRNTLGDPWNLSSGTEPYVGPVPDHENLSVAIGGFKISLGIAHWLTDKLECCCQG